jgi:nucleoside-diphosphate-sugar epimerase
VGKLVRVGDGSNLVDIVYVDNAAEAHLLAADALSPGAACAGRPYFITQGEPVELWPWLDQILIHLGISPVARSISYRTARTIGFTLETIYCLFKLGGEPRMTRFLAAQLAKDHFFDIKAARTDFGYVPRVSTSVGLERFFGSLAGD